jgi:hypothetical protein
MTGCGPDRDCIHPPEEHRRATRIGRAKIAFFERDDVHSSPLFEHENVFYRVKKGDLFWRPFRGARTKRKIKHGKERNLLVDESANLGQQG